MRYIGPFFRMNKLTQKEISGQLFHLSKETLKTLVFESKLGLVDSLKNYTKTSSSIDINTIGNISPLLCIYRKSSPNYIHNKSFNGFDEDTFKRDIIPMTNALMTINILNLSTYYSKFRDIDEKLYSYSLIYRQLAKEQLNFYSSNLRSSEGVFVHKKNTSENNLRTFNLVDKNNKFKFSDQAFMMAAYNLYSSLFGDDEIAMEYQSFSYEILEVLIEYKEKIYELPFHEILLITLALNLFFEESGRADAEDLIIDLTDYLLTKFDEKDYYVDSLEDASLFALVLMYSYKHTSIIAFKEKAEEILSKLTSLYDENKELYLKLSSRKEIRYSAYDLSFYFISLTTYCDLFNANKEYRDIISPLYRKCFINSGIINCWPEAPTLDDTERYKNLSLRAEDMLDEIFFRMPTMPTPSSLGVIPNFNKYVTYSRKRESFSVSSSSFDSYRNLLIHFLIINSFRNNVMKELNILGEDLSSYINTETESLLNNIQESNQVNNLFNNLNQNSLNSSNQINSLLNNVQENGQINNLFNNLNPNSLNPSNQINSLLNNVQENGQINDLFNNMNKNSLNPNNQINSLLNNVQENSLNNNNNNNNMNLKENLNIYNSLDTNFSQGILNEISEKDIELNLKENLDLYNSLDDDFFKDNLSEIPEEDIEINLNENLNNNLSEGLKDYLSETLKENNNVIEKYEENSEENWNKDFIEYLNKHSDENLEVEPDLDEIIILNPSSDNSLDLNDDIELNNEVIFEDEIILEINSNEDSLNTPNNYNDVDYDY